MPYLVGLAGFLLFSLVLRIGAGRSRQALLLGEDHRPSTSRAQLLLWAAIAIAVCLVGVIHCIHTSSATLPAIDMNLMILMGLGHSVYPGKKIAES